MREIYYRDIRVVPGEDRVVVVSKLFHALHGYQRRQGAGLVLVPLSFRRRDVRIAQADEAPDGLRVFSDAERMLADIVLHPSIDDAVQMKRIVGVDADIARRHIRVRRIRVPDRARIRRYERRRAKHQNHCIEHVAATIERECRQRPRPGIHFWLHKNGAWYPFFIAVEIHEGYARLQSTNTYGCGTAPLVDF